MENVNDFEILSYFLIGGFFICLSIFVFVMWRIKNSLRWCLFLLFLFFGFTLMNWGGKLLAQEEISYSLFALLSCFAAAIISSILVYHLYKIEKKKEKLCKNDNSYED